MLDLSELATGQIPAITPAVGEALAEAASVSLEWRAHTPGVTLRVKGISNNSYRLYWQPASDQALNRSWAVPDDSVHFGAVGIAVLLIVRETGFTTVERSVRGTGIDYWLGSPGGPPFQFRARLEISGILQGSDGNIRARVREKLNQTRRSDNTMLPAYVIVVEFSGPIAEVGKR